MNRNDTDLPKPAATLPPPEGEQETEQQLPLFSSEALKAVDAEEARWRKEMHDPLAAKKAPWKSDFTTVSAMDVNPLATPSDVAELDFERDLAFPGQFPYTRGIHPTGYRGKLGTMRQFAGFGTAAPTNER